MKTFLKMKLWPVIAGLLVAFIVMMIFEYVNSLFFPLPANTDLTNLVAIHSYTASLPWTAYILVFLGFVVGAFKAGCVTTYLSKEKTYSLSLIVGIVLVVFGLANNIAIGHSTIFNIISLPMFIIFTYLGHRYLLQAKKGKR